MKKDGRITRLAKKKNSDQVRKLSDASCTDTDRGVCVLMKGFRLARKAWQPSFSCRLGKNDVFCAEVPSQWISYFFIGRADDIVAKLERLDDD